MEERIHNLKNEALAQISSISDPEELESLRLHYLGRKGVINDIVKQIAVLPQEKRGTTGRLLNDIKQVLETSFRDKLNDQLSKEDETSQELTLPGKPKIIGNLHPTTIVINEINNIFSKIGFTLVDGPEVETGEYNFERLNLPPDHPARDLQDTLYLNEPGYLLRTHTSSVEAHILEDLKPPIRVVIPGKVYRYENVSASNGMMFYQYQGVALDRNLTLADLKGVLNYFIHQFYGTSRKSRFRSKYYPEVEPGVGIDIDCQFCQGKGCAICKGRGWLEILGAGMIHPNILRDVKINPDEYSGFAWGMGLDRIVMTRWGISDIRSLYNGDIVFNT